MDEVNDFDSFALILSSKIETHSDYYLLLPKCCSFIEQIMTTNSLPPQIQNQTRFFLIEVIPAAAKGIMKVMHVIEKELENCRLFIQSLIRMAQWGIFANCLPVVNILKVILDPNAIYYLQNPDELKIASDFFISSDFVNVISSQFGSSSICPSIDIFESIYTSISQLYCKNLITIPQFSRLVETSLPIFNRYIRSITIIDYPCSHILRTFESLFSFLVSFNPTQQFLKEMQNFIAFFYNLLISNSPEQYRIFGAKMLSYLTQQESTCDIMMICFIERNFIEYFINAQLSSNIINELLPLLYFLGDHDFISLNSLNDIWKSSYKIIDNTLNNLSSDETNEIFKSIQYKMKVISHAIISLPDQTKFDFLNQIFSYHFSLCSIFFAKEATKELYENWPGLALTCSNELLSSYTSNKYPNLNERLQQAILEIANDKSADLLKNHLYQKLSQDKELTSFDSQLLIGMINSIPDQISDHQLIRYIISQLHYSSKSLDFFLLYSQKDNFAINSDLVSLFWEACIDKKAFWHFISLAVLSEDGKKTLIDIAMKLPKEEYITALDFAKAIHSPELSSTFFIFSEDPSPFICLLEDISSPEMAAQFIIQAFKFCNSEGKKRAMDHIINTIERYEGGIDMTLLGILRHKPQKTDDFVSITFGQASLRVSPKISLKTLEQIFRCKVTSTAPIKEGAQIQVKYDSPISEEEEFNFDFLPTYILNFVHIQQKILESAMDCQPQSTKLLNLLPTDENVEKIIQELPLFFEQIKSNQEPHFFKYYIESLRENLSGPDFINANGPNLLQQISMNFEPQFLEDVFIILTDFPDDVNDNFIELAISIQIDETFSSAPKLRNIGYDLIISCLKSTKSESTMNLLYDNDAILKIFINVDDLTRSSFLSMLDSIPKIKFIIQFSLDLMTKIDFTEQCYQSKIIYAVNIIKEVINRTDYNYLVNQAFQFSLQIIRSSTNQLIGTFLLSSISSKYPSILQKLNQDDIKEIANCASKDIHTSTILKQLCSLDSYHEVFINEYLRQHNSSDSTYVSPNLLEQTSQSNDAYLQPVQFPPCSGLINHSMNCYANSIIQQFYGSSILFDAILKSNYFPMKELFQSMMNQGIGDPLSLFHNIDPNFDTSIPQDAAEFFEALCNKLPQSVTSIFTGALSIRIDATTGQFLSESRDVFVTLPLPIKNFQNVNESLHSLLQPEHLEGDNIYHDSSRNIFCNAIRNTSFLKLPQLLIFHLLRFGYGEMLEREKINSFFDIPLSLTICNKIYHLTGIVFHQGTTDYGHYTSAIRVNFGHNWRYANDSSVSEIPEEDVLQAARGGNDSNPNAYLLFYTEENALQFTVQKKVMEKSSSSSPINIIEEFYEQNKTNSSKLVEANFSRYFGEINNNENYHEMFKNLFQKFNTQMCASSKHYITLVELLIKLYQKDIIYLHNTLQNHINPYEWELALQCYVELSDQEMEEFFISIISPKFLEHIEKRIEDGYKKLCMRVILSEKVMREIMLNRNKEIRKEGKTLLRKIRNTNGQFLNYILKTLIEILKKVEMNFFNVCQNENDDVLVQIIEIAYEFSMNANENTRNELMVILSKICQQAQEYNVYGIVYHTIQKVFNK